MNLKQGSILLMFMVAGCDVFEKDPFSDLKRFVKFSDTLSVSNGNAEKKRLSPLDNGAVIKRNVITYDVLNLRSPFAHPEINVSRQSSKIVNNAEPDLNREFTALERIDLEKFQMVGTIDESSRRWGLVQANSNVYRVQVGDYLGRNYGKIVEISADSIQLVELILTEQGLWVEKHTKLVLKENR